MKRWLRIFLIGLGSLIGLVIAVVTVLFLFLYNSAINNSNANIAAWKKSGWISGKDFVLLTKALVAAEDPSFLSTPRLECGVNGLFQGWRKHNEFVCSPIISYAAKLTFSENYLRMIQRNFAELFIQGNLSKNPDEAIDIILNKTYLGAKKDGSPIEGFEKAAEFYFGQKLNSLGVSKLALLSGMVRAPRRFSPTVDSQKAKERRDAVIDQMARSQFISDSEATAAKSEPLQ